MSETRTYNRRYNAETAEHVGGNLYRKRTGEYFLRGDERNRGIRYDQAEEYARRNLPEETIERYFGEVPEDGTKKAATLSLRTDSIEKWKRIAAMNRLSLSEQVEALVEKEFQKLK